MADFPTIDAPEAEDDFSFSELVDSGQIDNMIIGATRAGHGFEQAIAEFKEAIGLEPEGHAEFVTQQLKQDEDILREASFDDQQLSGAQASEFIGEAGALFAVPFGGSVRAATALGGLASSGFFHEDVEEQSRLLDIGIGAGLGGLFRRLVQGGPRRAAAQDAADDAARSAKQLFLPAPAQRQGQRLLTDQRQLALPAPRARAVDPRASLSERGLSAADFQNAGRTPIRGVPQAATDLLKGSVGRGMERAREAAKAPRAAAQAALRKAQVFTRNAARKKERIEAALRSARKADEARAIAILERQATAATKDLIAGKGFQKAVQDQLSPPKSSPAQVAARQRAAESQELQKVIAEKYSDERMRGTLKGNTKAQIAEDIKDLGGNTLTESQIKRLTKPQIAAMAKGQAAKVRKGQEGFIQNDLVNTIAGAGVGAAIGGSASDGDPVAIAAGAITGGVAGRLLPRQLDRLTTNKQRQVMREADRAGSAYVAEVSRATKLKDFSGQTIAKVLQDGRKVLDEFMGSTMTRLEQLAPRVAVALKEAEFGQHFRSGQWIGQGDRIFKRLDDAGLTDVQMRKFKIAMMNSTKAGKAYLQGIGKSDTVGAVEEMESLLSDVGRYLGEVDLGRDLRANYFPRMVTDPSQFENIEEVRTYLGQLAKKKGVKLTDFEKETAITQVINGALTRGPDQTHFGRASANLKKRTVKVNDKNVDAYAGLHESFNDYIESITTQVERRRFFQGQGVKVDDLGPNAENIDSVAARLKDQLKRGELDEDQLEEVTQLIRMRFGPGEQAPSKLVQNFKNLTYAGLLGNPLSAMTQFGDIALSAHRNGVRNTAVSVMENIMSRGKADRGLDKETLLGIRNAATDFASRTGTRDLLNWSLKYSGFQAVDKLGKNTFIQSAMRKNQQMSKEDFLTRWRPIFDPDAAPGAAAPRTEELFNKVQGFKKIDDTNREDIGFMLWNELEGVQPIAVSALPERYLRHPDGRVAYMLQSFTLKLFDVMRKDIYNKARAGDIRGATANAAKLSSLFVTMNGGVDSAKNFILGRDETVPEVVMNNYLKLLGANRYILQDAQQSGVGEALLKLAAPPTVLLDAVGSPRDALKIAPPLGKVIESRIPE
jgi:outer membrane lipoprotein SlyB